MTSPPLHLVTPVWGEEYTRNFVEITLPALLAPGNIPAIPNAASSRYTIYATPFARTLIEASPAYALLKTYMPVEIRPIVSNLAQKHRASSDCYREAVRIAAAAGAAAVFLIPDMVLADGSIRAMVRILESGKRVILITGLRVIKNRIIGPLKAQFAHGATIVVPAARLVELALAHLHPITQTHLYDEEGEYFHPAGFFWRVGDEGFILRCFHLHPVAILPRVTTIDFEGTIDDDLTEKSGILPEETHIVTDSDEILWLETSDIDNTVPTPRRAGMEAIVAWMNRNTTPYHHTLIGYTTRLHTDRQTPALWDAAQARSDAVIDSMLAAARQPTPGMPAIPPEWPRYNVVQHIAPVLFTWERNALGVMRDLRHYRPQTAAACLIVAASAAYLAWFWSARFIGRWVHRSASFLLRGGRPPDRS